MSANPGTLRRVRLIAGNTFLEAVRQKFFNSLLLIAVALVGSAQFFQQFDFGANELKFITDFGFGALFFFGSILAIAATAQLFFAEIENRTALTMLAKPVTKLEFLAGKFAGAQLLMLVFTAVVTLVLAGILSGCSGCCNGSASACWRRSRSSSPVSPIPISIRSSCRSSC
jgi:ABC-type transport system involved in multi-copper enzyme maturation permease subunit